MRIPRSVASWMRLESKWPMMGWTSRYEAFMTNLPAWTREEFEQQLRAKECRYHIYHPFHVAMNNGLCSREQVQGWVYNRFYYQIAIPLKDAAVLANMTDRE